LKLPGLCIRNKYIEHVEMEYLFRSPQHRRSTNMKGFECR
jgi:hypothetical protein